MRNRQNSAAGQFFETDQEGGRLFLLDTVENGYRVADYAKSEAKMSGRFYVSCFEPFQRSVEDI